MKRSYIIFSLLLGVPLLLGLCVAAINLMQEARFAYTLKSSTLPAEQVWYFEADELILDALLSPKAVYFLTASDIYAVNRITGKPIWHIERNYVTQLIPLSSAEDDALVVVFGKTLEVIDAKTGHSKWSVEVGKVVRSNIAGTISIAVAEGRVFVGADVDRQGRLMALDMEDGEPLWDSILRFEEGGVLDLHFYGKQLFVGGSDFWYIEPKSGAIVNSKSRPEIRQQLIYDTDQIYAVRPNSGVYALDPITLSRQWMFAPPCKNADMWIVSLSRRLSNSVFIEVSCPKDWLSMKTSLYRLDAESGKRVWGYAPAHSILSFIPMAGYGYYFQLNGSVHAVDLSDGHEVGALQVEPPQLRDLGRNTKLVSDEILLILLFGTKQAFAFQEEYVLADVGLQTR